MFIFAAMLQGIKHIIFDLGGDSLVRIPTLEPLRGTAAHVGKLLDSVDSAAELVDQLTT